MHTAREISLPGFIDTRLCGYLTFLALKFFQSLLFIEFLFDVRLGTAAFGQRFLGLTFCLQN
jgi:hypothetical protein